jgi:hypothetical protein
VQRGETEGVKRGGWKEYRARLEKRARGRGREEREEERGSEGERGREGERERVLEHYYHIINIIMSSLWHHYGIITINFIP